MKELLDILELNGIEYSKGINHVKVPNHIIYYNEDKNEIKIKKKGLLNKFLLVSGWVPVDYLNYWLEHGPLRKLVERKPRAFRHTGPTRFPGGIGESKLPPFKQFFEEIE